MKKDMFDNRYEYYFYVTDNIDENMNNGIEILGGNQFCGTMKNVFINDNNFMNQLSCFCNKYNCKNVLVVRIPLYYLGWMHRNGVKESFVPIFKCIFDKINFSIKTMLIPELIFGVYDSDNMEFRYNENYDVFYNPDGLQFSDEQIANMYRYGCFNSYQNAFNRKKYDYEDLKRFDMEHQIWDKTMKYYRASKVKKLFLNLNKNHEGRR